MFTSDFGKKACKHRYRFASPKEIVLTYDLVKKYVELSLSVCGDCGDLLMVAVVEAVVEAVWEEAVAGLVSPAALSQEDMASQVR